VSLVVGQEGPADFLRVSAGVLYAAPLDEVVYPYGDVAHGVLVEFAAGAQRRVNEVFVLPGDAGFGQFDLAVGGASGRPEGSPGPEGAHVQVYGLFADGTGKRSGDGPFIEQFGGSDEFPAEIEGPHVLLEVGGDAAADALLHALKRDRDEPHLKRCTQHGYIRV